MSFVHLHNHSHFSLLDGLGKPGEYVNRAVELGQRGLALTDHGSLSGLYQLWKECKEVDIKPIAGCEFYIAPESRHNKAPVYFGTEDQRSSDVSGTGAYCHITILARNSRGVRNLFRLQAESYRTGFYRKPRIDLELLQQYSEGLICLTGCPGSILSTYARINQREHARAHLAQLIDIFGDDLYVELMSHGIDFEEQLNQTLLELANELQVPVVATADSHYCLRSDDTIHQSLLCLQTNSKLADPKFTFSGEGYHLTSTAEMEHQFVEANLPTDAIAATAVILEKIESYDDVFHHQLRMPVWGGDAESELNKRVMSKALEWGNEYEQRMRYELDTITSLGFADYFLVVGDILDEAKKRNIRLGPLRGSIGGSLVAYALGIHAVDPIPTRMLFERFLNPERVGLPDIDIDIQEDRREEFLEVARDLCGEECVASLGTFGTVGAKAALKDSARVLGYSYRTGEERTWQLPKPRFGKQPTLKEYGGPKDDIYDLAVGLEGTVRNEGVHAAGVVISPEPLDSIIPLRRPGGVGGFVTSFDMHEIESMGLVKTDFLGLRTLKVIDDCLRMLPPLGQTVEVHMRTSVAMDALGGVPGDLPTDPRECTDQATYKLLSSGDTLGVFQLDSPGMRGLLRKLQPTSFGDVSAVVALYRPGPMAANAHLEYAKRQYRSIHPELEAALNPILVDTYGLIVFQEQVLEVLAAVGDYTYGSAELIFNAMRKKQHDKMAAAKPDFVGRMTKNGYSNGAIDALWGTLVPFADYSFNKSHSTGYALIAYWCAYLKANHPHEWMAALLSNEDDNNKRDEYLNECSRMGIDVLPPDVNVSGSSFTPTLEGIRYGLHSIKGVGKAAIDPMTRRRPFKSLSDWYNRAPATALNLGVLTALIKSGALDSLAPREGHLASCEKLSEKARSERNAKQSGQRGLIKARYSVKSGKPSPRQRQAWEKETLGLALTVTDVTIRPNGFFHRGALEWIRNVFLRHPGRDRVKLDLGAKTPYDTQCEVDIASAERELRMLDVEIHTDET